MKASKWVEQFSDERYYRTGRFPRHFQHNATKMSKNKAHQIAKEYGGVAKECVGPVPLGQ